MRDDRFEWDDRKAADNYRKHDVSFELARMVFDDTHAVVEIDDDPDEERWHRIGMANNLMLLVVYTQRKRRYRIISSRRANKHEHDKYFTRRP